MLLVTIVCQLVEENGEEAAIELPASVLHLLNVSRPHLVKLLETGKIPFHKVGTHRRVRFEDLMDYKENIDRQRMKTLDELTAQAQELNLGYDSFEGHYHSDSK